MGTGLDLWETRSVSPSFPQIETRPPPSLVKGTLYLPSSGGPLAREAVDPIGQLHLPLLTIPTTAIERPPMSGRTPRAGAGDDASSGQSARDRLDDDRHPVLDTNLSRDRQSEAANGRHTRDGSRAPGL